MTNIPSLIAAIRDSQPREHTPLCYTPDVCQCGANVYNALRNHALALCEAVESSKKLYELALSNQMNWMKKWEEEVDKRKLAATPICIGPPLISILAKEGQWISSETGAGIIAADGLFHKDPYEELAAERLAKEAAEKERDGLKLKAADRDEWQDVAMKVSAERDALLRDKERLDWLEQNGYSLYHNEHPDMSNKNWCVRTERSASKSIKELTPRDAIDAAMPSQPPPASHVSVDEPQP